MKILNFFLCRKIQLPLLDKTRQALDAVSLATKGLNPLTYLRKKNHLVREMSKVCKITGKKPVKAVKMPSDPKSAPEVEEIPTDELIKRRIEMLNLEEDDEGIDQQREKKKKEARRQLLVMESTTNSRYRGSKDKENQGVKYSVRKFDHPKVISLDSKVHGSLLQGKE